MTDKGGIIEIRDVLKTEFQKFAAINTVLKDTSDHFNKIDDTYTTYSSEMDVAKNHILKLKRREFFENLFIYIGLCIFFVCVIYIMLKRFPLHRLIYLGLDILLIFYNTANYVARNILIKNSNNTIHQYNITSNYDNSSIMFNISNEF